MSVISVCIEGKEYRAWKYTRIKVQRTFYGGSCIVEDTNWSTRPEWLRGNSFKKEHWFAPINTWYIHHAGTNTICMMTEAEMRPYLGQVCLSSNPTVPMRSLDAILEDVKRNDAERAKLIDEISKLDEYTRQQLATSI